MSTSARLASSRAASRSSGSPKSKAILRLFTVEAEIVGTAFLDERRPPGPRVVSHLWPLHLYYVGPEIPEIHRRQWPREHPRKVGHHETFERRL